MSKANWHCGLFAFSLLLGQTAGFGFVLTGRWLYLVALILSGVACTSSLLLCLDNKPQPTPVENHYHFYYDTAPPQCSPSRW